MAEALASAKPSTGAREVGLFDMRMYRSRHPIIGYARVCPTFAAEFLARKFSLGVNTVAVVPVAGRVSCLSLPWSAASCRRLCNVTLAHIIYIWIRVWSLAWRGHAGQST